MIKNTLYNFVLDKTTRGRSSNSGPSLTIRLSEPQAVYSPGDNVTGRVVLETSTPIRVRCLRITVRGVSRVHWTESVGSGTRFGAYAQQYTAAKEYFTKRIILLDQGMINQKKQFSTSFGR